MKRSYISDLERGLRNPTLKAIARLASALDVEPASLLRTPINLHPSPEVGYANDRHPGKRIIYGFGC